MKEIPGFPGYYATVDGEIISMRSIRPRLLVRQILKGYYHVFVRRGLGRKTKVKMPVHQLVLMAYKGPKPHPALECRHLDGNRFHNYPDNLEWGTHTENMQDSIKHGTAVCLRLGESHNRSKLTQHEVKRIYFEVNQGVPQAIIASRYGISQHHVSDIKLQKTWKHLWAV